MDKYSLVYDTKGVQNPEDYYQVNIFDLFPIDHTELQSSHSNKTKMMQEMDEYTQIEKLEAGKTIHIGNKKIQAFIFVYDTSQVYDKSGVDTHSFDWIKQTLEAITESEETQKDKSLVTTVKYIVANKKDMKQRKVNLPIDKLQNLADFEKVYFKEVSALTNHNVNEMFKELLDATIDAIKEATNKQNQEENDEEAKDDPKARKDNFLGGGGGETANVEFIDDDEDSEDEHVKRKAAKIKLQ